MLYPDDDIVRRLRAQDPHGRLSNTDLERMALISQLHEAVGTVPDDTMRDILATIVSLL